MHPLIEKAKRQGRHPLEPETLQVLEHYGIPVPQHRFVHTETEAIEVAKALGWPVVLKIVSPDILHKTEEGGVILDLQNEKEVRDAFLKLTSLAGTGKRVEGVMVYPFTPHEVEMFVGMMRDAQFGPVITFGLGGIWVEVFRDVVYGIAPLSMREAEEMIRSIKGYSILSGRRGKGPADIQSLGELLVRFSRMALDEPDIKEMDLNPVFPQEKGFFIADARILL